jgi:hypothetical protein
LSDQTLSLGKINEQLGFTVSGEYLKELGFEPVAKDKRAMLYSYEQYKGICAAVADEMGKLAQIGVRTVTPRVVVKRVPKADKGATPKSDLPDPDDNPPVDTTWEGEDGMSGATVRGEPDPDDDEL